VASRCLVVLVLVAACGNDVELTPDATIADAFDPGPDELPCDVEAALLAACTTCHASPPNSGAPQSLVSRYDFFKPATTLDGQSVAQQALVRLHDSLRPMPPASEPPASAAQLAVLQAWLEAGTPPGSCGAIAPKPAPTSCPSMTFWTDGETGSELMLPGKPCRACHQVEATQLAYFFAGTVYDTFYTQDLCNSPPPSGARIELLDDADGTVTMTLLPDAAGNFTSLDVSPGVPTPYRARLVANGLAREMTTAQTNGDCNGCHTEQGTHVLPATLDAPGRLVWPAPAP
jgi:hypothetical protein